MPNPEERRVWPAVVAGLVAALVFTGCAGTAASTATGVTSPSDSFAAENSGPACADWVPFDTVDHAAADAELVVRAEIEPTDTTVTVHGEEASLHRAIVTEVYIGDASIGDVLDVVSTPSSCTAGSPYPDGDPMLREEATLVLNAGNPAPGSTDFMETITPYAGVWE